MSTTRRCTDSAPRRAGAVPPMTALMLGSVLLLGCLGLALGELRARTDQTTRHPPLILYCASGVQAPITDIARQYTEDYGTPVEIQFAGSGTLLAQIEINPRGDLYLAADDAYIPIGREKGLLTETTPLARQRPVIAVAAGNPRGIRALDDLLAEDIDFALANPDAAAIGSVTRDTLAAIGAWEAFHAACKVYKPCVTDLLTDLKVGSVDAAIIWDCNASQTEGIEAVEIKEFAQADRTIEIALLAASKHPRAARHFARYAAARDRGGASFDRYGYRSVPRDSWTESTTGRRGEQP